MNIIPGDLLDLAKKGHFDVIVHGCNCQHIMGSGIAAQIRKQFPEAYEVDLTTPKGVEKLGTISFHLISKPNTYTNDLKYQFYVVNAYTQGYPGRGSLSYDALEKCFQEVKNNFSGSRIGYPLIGAGIAGGDWRHIAPRIEKALEGEDHTLVVLP